MKIAICVPCHGNPKFDFVASLAALLIHSPKLQPGLELVYVTVEGSDLARQRNILAEQALQLGAEYLLWIDSDHDFPPDSLVRLLAHGQEVVGINQPMRGPDRIPSATGLDGKRVTSTADKPLEAVAHPGLGMCLVAASRLRVIERPFFATGQEDVYFFGKLRASGATVYVDHKLSMEVGHIAETILRF